MNNKNKIKKLHTQCLLNWSLKVGDQLGTLSKPKAIKLANVKPAVFHRWKSGKLAAPSCKLNRIKHHAFATLRIRHRKKLNLCLAVGLDEEMIRAQFLWKNMIFDQLSMVAKRRFFTGLKKRYR
ncbi:MAG TPA: hypothetical protein VK958_12645 [Methylophilus sp.]|uniref:hypothetical protein n=1 Tax=Methylophilus sp. TaxID=29541 RepID=UPI002CA824BC|nr:hypothetical protein [Methylophilus sp.]HSH88087.1 hypothetical protein [Methylophilus sp.]